LKKQARITSKGQITVPHEIRRAMGVGPGDQLEFEQKGNEIHVRAVHYVSPFEKYRGIGNPGIGTGRKAIIKWIRDLRGE